MAIPAPPPPGFIVPLRYDEIFGAPASREALRALLSKVDWRGIVEVASMVSSVSWQDGIETPRHQIPFFRNLEPHLIYGAALAMRLLTEPHRPVVTRESLLAVLRVAITLSVEVETDQRTFSDTFVKAALMANELLQGEVTAPEHHGAAEDLLPSELRSAVLHFENLHDLLGRTDALFLWSRTERARASPHYLPIEADLQRFSGLTWPEYAASGYLCLARCTSISHPAFAGRLSALFYLDQWLAGLAESAKVRQWFNVSSVAVAQLRVDWSEAESLSFAASGALWRKPVVRADRGGFFVPHAPLVQNTIGDGMFFLLLDGYRSDSPDGAVRRRFTQFYGDFFQDYIAERLTSGYAGRADVVVRTEGPYFVGRNRVMSTDVIVFESDDNVLFVEVMAKRPKLIESVVALSDEAIEEDSNVFISKARELSNRIHDFREGLLFPDMPRPPGQRIYPIIVTPTTWPRIHLLHTILPRAIAREDLLLGTEPIEILDAGDVELLEAGLQNGIRLSQLLLRKNGRGQITDGRYKSVRDYLSLYEPGLLGNVRRPIRLRGDDVAHGILELAHSWWGVGPPVFPL